MPDYISIHSVFDRLINKTYKDFMISGFVITIATQILKICGVFNMKNNIQYEKSK